jgi:hypothetical protein
MPSCSKYICVIIFEAKVDDCKFSINMDEKITRITNKSSYFSAAAVIFELSAFNFSKVEKTNPGNILPIIGLSAIASKQ